MNRWLSLIILLMTVTCPLAKERPGKFVALVIGNGKYYLDKEELRGPRADALDVSDLLRKAGFKVTNAGNTQDLTREQMIKAVEGFVRQIDRSSLALFYYSGHGIEYEQQNYLVPVDAQLRSNYDVAGQLVKFHEVTKMVARQDPLASIFILDACRNMPRHLLPETKDYGNSGGLNSQRNITVSNRGYTRTVYAADGNQKALAAADGDRNSLYTGQFLKAAMNSKNKTLSDIIQVAGAEVSRLTRGAQTPMDAGTSSGTVELSFSAASAPDAPSVQPETQMRFPENSSSTKKLAPPVRYWPENVTASTYSGKVQITAQHAEWLGISIDDLARRIATQPSGAEALWKVIVEAEAKRDERVKAAQEAAVTR